MANKDIVKTQRAYELALVINPDLDESGRDGVIQFVEKLITQLKGAIKKREQGGKKVLAYPVAGQTNGWYYFQQIELPPESVGQLNTKLKMEEKILRYLLIKK